LILSHRLSLAEESDTVLQETLMQEYYENIQSESLPKLQSTVSLFGRINTEGYSYRSTIGVMESLVAELEQMPGVEIVLLIETAVDVRETSRFTGQVGREDNDGIADADKFEILVVLEPATNA
jgi:hypothetical protein